MKWRIIDRVGKKKRFVLNVAHKGSAKWTCCRSFERRICWYQINQSMTLTLRFVHQIVNNIVWFAPKLKCFFPSGKDASYKHKKKFNDKTPSVKRWRSIVRTKMKFRDVSGLTGDCYESLQKVMESLASSNANQWDNGTSKPQWRWIKISREKYRIADTFYYFDRSVKR